MWEEISRPRKRPATSELGLPAAIFWGAGSSDDVVTGSWLLGHAVVRCHRDDVSRNEEQKQQQKKEAETIPRRGIF